MSQKALKLAFLLLLCSSIVKSDRAIRDLCWWKLGTFPHPNAKLCNQFVQCQIFNGVVNACEAGKVYVENQGCLPGNAATCEPTVVSNSWLPQQNEPLLTTRPPPPPLIDLNEFCAMVGATVILPNPNDCRSLVICREGFFLGTFTCPPEAPVVDFNRAECVQGNPDTCETGEPTTTTPEPPTLPTTPPPPPPTTVFPPTEIPTTLPPPDEPTLVPTTTTPQVPTTTTTAPPPADICRGNNLRFVADPNVCYRFFYCLFGVPLPGKCEPDRIFDEFFRGCVRGNQVTCIRDRFINVTVVTPTRSSSDDE